VPARTSSSARAQPALDAVALETLDRLISSLHGDFIHTPLPARHQNTLEGHAEGGHFDRLGIRRVAVSVALPSGTTNI
jgi:hypothetical protein